MRIMGSKLTRDEIALLLSDIIEAICLLHGKDITPLNITIKRCRERQVSHQKPPRRFFDVTIGLEFMKGSVTSIGNGKKSHGVNDSNFVRPSLQLFCRGRMKIGSGKRSFSTIGRSVSSLVGNQKYFFHVQILFLANYSSS